MTYIYILRSLDSFHTRARMSYPPLSWLHDYTHHIANTVMQVDMFAFLYPNEGRDQLAPNQSNYNLSTLCLEL
jgi:hypothetical protein